MLNKNNSSELTDEDILRGVTPIGKLAEEKINNKIQNDFVDSSLFMADEFPKDTFKNEQLNPVNNQEKMLNAKQSIRNTDIKKAKTGEGAVTATETAQEVSEKEIALSAINDDVIVIQADKNDARSYAKGKLAGVMLVLAGVGIAGYVFWDKSQNKETAILLEEVSTENNEETPQQISDTILDNANDEIEETVIPQVDISKVKIDVFNGSGVAGVAGKAKDLLVKEKYENVEAKNYPSDNVAESAVYYKEDVFKEEAQKIANFLKTGNIEMPVKLASKEEEKSADIVVVLGR